MRDLKPASWTTEAGQWVKAIMKTAWRSRMLGPVEVWVVEELARA